MENKKIAVLLTCFNRVKQTLECLEHLFEQALPEDCEIEVFLLDDASADKTGELVKEKFPQVNVIMGTGELFWGGGMRLAWKMAVGNYAYDYYVWLNDDTFLLKDALIGLFDDYKVVENGIITGACYDVETKEFSYGGRDDKGIILPDGHVQMCKYINGNIVLVPKNIFESIGGLSEDFTHTIGDYEYGMRCLKNNFQCWCSSKYLGTCTANSTGECYDPKTPISRRLKLLYSPKGLNLKEYIHFRKLYCPKSWILDWFKAHLRAIMPRLYKSLKGASK